mgnify:CR=1 FL=1
MLVSRIEIASSSPDRNHRTDLAHLFGIVNWPGKAMFGSKSMKRLTKISVFNYLASKSSSRADILCRLRFSNLPGSILKGFGSTNQIFFRVFGFIGIFLFPYLVLSSCLCCTLHLRLADSTKKNTLTSTRWG